MKFAKMHGAGNDFIIINNMDGAIPTELLPRLAAGLCAQHISVGADGLMVVARPEHGGDYRMLFFNSDGSTGEMCGNGARCIARYGYENGLAGETQRIETTAGLVVGQRVSERLYRIRLNDPSVVDLHRIVNVGGEKYDCAYVELGNPGIPHAILCLPDHDERDRDELRSLGRALRYAPEFPRGANVSFVKETGTGSVKAVTYERGVEDLTLACGTGCGSIAVALRLLGRSGDEFDVSMPGGKLHTSLSVVDGAVRDIYLTGPTNYVCTGEILDEDVLPLLFNAEKHG